MRLANFILANIEPILAEWEVFARAIWPGAATDPATLRDHAEDMLRAAAMDMKSEQTARQQADKSKGKGDTDPQHARIDRASAAHGAGRVESGFDLAALIAEYRALRASVVRLWRESERDPDLHDLDDVTRFNEAIDQSLTEAVLAYTQHVERDRQAAVALEQQYAVELREVNDALLVSSVRQNELMEQAETASRAKDQFLAVLSHELRTPLTPVMMTLNAMERDLQLAPAVRDDVRVMRRNVELEGKLIDDLLDISRITSGKLRLQFEILDINKLLRDVCESCRQHIWERGLHLHCDLDEGVDYVVGDPARLQQVFWNLLNNAAKFTPEGGQIHIASANAGENGHGNVRVIVSDTGRGIPSELLPRVFDAFEQGDVRMTRQFGGLGLGLSISKLLVERQQGSIRVESKGLNKGASFFVELTAISREEVEASDRPSPSNTVGIPPLNLLVVDDHYDTATVLGRLLRRLGHDVKTASTGSDALALASAHHFDLVVSDLGLPDMSGLEVMRRIKDLYGTDGIAISGFGMDDDIKRSKDAGFGDHLVKPVSFDQLERSIRRVAGFELGGQAALNRSMGVANTSRETRGRQE